MTTPSLNRRVYARNKIAMGVREGVRAALLDVIEIGLEAMADSTGDQDAGEMRNTVALSAKGTRG